MFQRILLPATECLIGVLLFVILGLPASAYATEGSHGNGAVSSRDIQAAFANLNGLEPGLIAEPYLTSQTDEALARGALAGGIQIEVSSESGVQVSFSGVPEVSDVTIRLGEDTEGSSSAERADDGSVIIPSTNGIAHSIVPTESGVQLLSVVPETVPVAEVEYAFEVPSDTVLEDRGDYFLLVSPSVGTLGMIQQPWAFDSQGRAVPTDYQWSGGVLTQLIDGSEGFEFPIVADPEYTYSWTFGMNGSPNDVKWVLKSPGMFDDYFPVPGAPANFPNVGQILPLRMLGCNGEVRVRSESTQYNYFGWDFTAGPNHVDGYGSLVVFEFRQRPDGSRVLQVSAWVNRPHNFQNDLIFAAQKYLIAPYVWSTFASNINWGGTADAGPREGVCPALWAS